MVGQCSRKQNNPTRNPPKRREIKGWGPNGAVPESGKGFTGREEVFFDVNGKTNQGA